MLIFFFNGTATTEIYTLSLHDALPISAFLVVVPNAPEGFARNARNGLRALRKLDEGRLAFEDGVWSLSGKTTSAEARASALANINDLADGAGWKTQITVTNN